MMNAVCPACGARNRFPEERLGSSPHCGRCQAPLLPAEPVDLDDQSLDRYLQHTDLPVLIDFWAPWCGPCGMMAPHFAEAAGRTPGVRFVKVNTDTSPASAIRWAIRGIPSLILTRHGRELGRLAGARSAAQLSEWIEQQLELERARGASGS